MLTSKRNRSDLHAWRDFLARRVRTLLVFGGGQLSLQFLTALSGIVLIRWMTIENYSKYGLAQTFQSSLGLLVELGLESGVIALVGAASNDPECLGKYLKSAFHLRARLVLIVWLLAVGLVMFAGQRQRWSLPEQTLILIGTCGGFASSLGLSLCGLPLIIRRNLKAYYGVLNLVAAVRLTLIFVLGHANALNAETVLLAGAGAGVVGIALFRYLGRDLYVYPPKPDAAVTKSLIRYIAPLIPGVVYLSLQGQATLMMVSYFGVARPVAEVAALGRLGQLFALLTAFNGVVIGPAAAKLNDGAAFSKFYRRAVTASLLLAGMLSLAAFLLPGPLLWLLGPKYSGLKVALRLMVASSCINYVSSVLWCMHAARAWVFWWSTWLFIGLLFTIQLLGMLLLAVQTTIGACELTVIMSIGVLFVHIVVGMYGHNRRHPAPKAEVHALAC